MNVNPVSVLSAVPVTPVPTAGPRAVSAEATRLFRESMSAATCGQPASPCPAEPSSQKKLNEVFDFSIEKVLMDNMPSAQSSPAEFALGLLRAQVKVSQAAIAIETVSKTTQSLSQGVQSLTARS